MRNVLRRVVVVVLFHNEDSSYFDTAPPETCATYLGMSAVSHKKFPIVSFFVFDIASNTK